MKNRYLGYCNNIHPGESLDEVYKNIFEYTVKVRENLAWKSISSGLWLSNQAVEQLQDKNSLEKFKSILAEAKIDLHTLNGFPFGGFHDEVVKQKVYLPDWSDKKRLNYTMKLAKILAESLAKDEKVGTISTLPLGYKSTWSDYKNQESLKLLNILSIFLDSLKREKSKKILVCFEPEPDCVIESTKELIEFFDLLKSEVKYPEYFGVCFDVCHQAVMGEDMKRSLELIGKNSIPLGKIQLSNALGFDPTKIDKQNLLKSMDSFSDKRYLHQVKSIDEKGNLNSWNDLESSKEQLSSYSRAFRVHFHIPLHLETLKQDWMFSTSKQLKEVLEFLKQNPQIDPHLEVETYSWQVLPKELSVSNDKELIEGISKELLWVERNLKV